MNQTLLNILYILIVVSLLAGLVVVWYARGTPEARFYRENKGANDRRRAKRKRARRRDAAPRPMPPFRAVEARLMALMRDISLGLPPQTIRALSADGVSIHVESTERQTISILRVGTLIVQRSYTAAWYDSAPQEHLNVISVLREGDFRDWREAFQASSHKSGEAMLVSDREGPWWDSLDNIINEIREPIAEAAQRVRDQAKSEHQATMEAHSAAKRAIHDAHAKLYSHQDDRDRGGPPPSPRNAGAP